MPESESPDGDANSLYNNNELGFVGRMASRFRKYGVTVEPGDDEYNAIQITDDNYEQFRDALEENERQDGHLLRVRPPRDNDGIQAGVRLWRALHDPRREKVSIGPTSKLTFVKNVSPSHSQEIWYNNGKVEFLFRPANTPATDTFRSKIRNNYQDASVERASQPFPQVDVGDWVAGATVRKSREFWYPIKSPLTERGDRDPIVDEDPYKDITSSMVVENDHLNDGTRVEADECRIVIQTLAQPARRVWTHKNPFGMDVEQVERSMKQPEYKTNHLRGDVYELEPGRKDKTAARIVRKLQDIPGFYVTMRVLVISPYRELAERRARKVAGDYRRYFESFTRQTLTPNPIPQSALFDTLLDTARRDHEISTRDRLTAFNPMKNILSVPGLGSVAHLPNDDINEPTVDWTSMDTGPGAPPGTDQVQDIISDDEDDDSGRVQDFDPEEYEQEYADRDVDESDDSGFLSRLFG